MGMVFRKGKVVLGKVINYTLSITVEGHEEIIQDNFNILTYENGCRNFYNKCVRQLADVKCDCMECYEVALQ